MENEFITIGEAAQLTGRTSIDVMRLIKDRLQDSGLEIESIMKKEQRGPLTMYLIHKGFLLEQFHASQEIQEEQEVKIEQPQGAGELFQAKEEMISILRGIIETKDKQMEDLSKKIDQLIERDRETNILLKGLQERMFLLEDSKTASPSKRKTEQK